MTRTITLLTLAASAALAGCNQEDHNIVAAGPYDEANVEANIALPPAIAASKIYRCKDNSVVYVDWLADNRSANLRTERGGSPTHLMAPEPGQPLVAEGGYSLTGDAAAGSVTLAVPGKGAQSCKA